MFGQRNRRTQAANVEMLRRMHRANAVLKILAETGPRYFAANKRVGRFESVPYKNGSLPAFVDPGSDKYVFMAFPPRAGDGFTLGPDLRRFLGDLDTWIRRGGIPPEIGDRSWGYGDELFEVRERARDIFENGSPAPKPPAAPANDRWSR